ncbi:hypothetical protein CLV87_2437 [Pelagimonas phthalicica]|nr:hypothetical protein CLV87_2437 [Pelagimonas phthalicica]
MGDLKGEMAGLAKIGGQPRLEPKVSIHPRDILGPKKPRASSYVSRLRIR